MNIDEGLINKLIEKEIKKQITSKIDKSIERIITREINNKLSNCNFIDEIAKEINNDEDFKRRVATSCATELYKNLVSKNYQDSFDYYED